MKPFPKGILTKKSFVPQGQMGQMPAPPPDQMAQAPGVPAGAIPGGAEAGAVPGQMPQAMPQMQQPQLTQDPQTGLLIDQATGQAYDPQTGQPVDMNQLMAQMGQQGAMQPGMEQPAQSYGMTPDEVRQVVREELGQAMGPMLDKMDQLMSVFGGSAQQMPQQGQAVPQETVGAPASAMSVGGGAGEAAPLGGEAIKAGEDAQWNLADLIAQTAQGN